MLAKNTDDECLEKFFLLLYRIKKRLDKQH